MTKPSSQARHVLDLRAIPPRDRHPLIFGQFDSLAAGESLQLVNDHSPQPLRLQFEERACGQFEWVALETGPALWRIQITRMTAAGLPPVGTPGSSCCSGGACCA